MTILAPHDASRVRNLALGFLHTLAANEGCEVPDIVALITPSQPGPTSSRPAAPAPVPAPTDAKAEEAAPITSSADPSPELPTPTGNAPEAESRSTWSRPTASGDSLPASDTKRAALLRYMDAHPDEPAKVIAKEVGCSEDLVRATASKFKRKLVSWWDYERAQKAKTTEALRGAPEKPVEPEGRAGPPTPRADPERQPVSTAAARFRVVATDGRYVHKRLQPSHIGLGVKLTDQPEMAWTPTEAQFAEAARKFPALKAMRWEAVP